MQTPLTRFGVPGPATITGSVLEPCCNVQHSRRGLTTSCREGGGEEKGGEVGTPAKQHNFVNCSRVNCRRQSIAHHIPQDPTRPNQTKPKPNPHHHHHQQERQTQRRRCHSQQLLSAKYQNQNQAPAQEQEQESQTSLKPISPGPPQ
ncbi:hypothetical protein M5D96_005940 [Drosophila gunungcola]|uniref:Uncharacterized protein n=1 Tax=Drosophila gunungcola TaxID=103775 RepID=A0A9Q0BRX2_9MUSC|nr:hypothetical protein M5D96_005940 [Drosophila gunungcola]